jgi:hypothetical protein
MVTAHSFSPETFSLAEFGRWLGLSSATAMLIGLSAFNALHGPTYDCVRAGAHFLRSRRGGPCLSLINIEQAQCQQLQAAISARK